MAENNKQNNSNQDSQEKFEKNKQENNQNLQDAKQENAGKESKEEETVSLSQEEYNGIKLQMAKVINDYKELEKDLDNYRKRSRTEVENAKIDGLIKALEVILPTLDTFKKAKKVIKDQSSIDGLNMIEKGINEALNKLDVHKIECINKKFDPNYHNAVLSIADAKHKAGTIVEEIESGYVLGDKVIKFSQVVVAKEQN